LADLFERFPDDPSHRPPFFFGGNESIRRKVAYEKRWNPKRRFHSAV
jgi:hypothetical protein